jgi:1,4-dihydroxy-2-naphthoate polyprenyltransferase
MTAEAADRSVGPALAWWLALRPKTLVIALAVVAVGVAAASLDGQVKLLPALGALLGALLLQVASNFANDLFDFRKGADTPDRIGPTRAVAAGLLSERAVVVALLVVLAASALVGAWLTTIGSWPILAIGLTGMAAAVLYTGGPWPLAYHGLGDLFVFVYFGLAAVAGTAHLQTGTWEPVTFALGVPMGCLGAAVLTVNNIRDLETDTAAGKRTIPVRLGRSWARVYYGLLLVAPYVSVAMMVGADTIPARAALTLLSLPFAGHLLVIVGTRTDGLSLNRALGRTAGLLLLFGGLLAVGLVTG